MKKIFITAVAALVSAVCFSSCSKVEMDSMPYDIDGEPLPTQRGAGLAQLDLQRAIELIDSGMSHYFTGDNMTMLRYYNPVTRSAGSEVGSVWMYTSAIEAVNSVLLSLGDMRAQVPQLYAATHDRYVELLSRLYDGLKYYAGTYTLTSYTQTKEWRVYGVNRANDPEGADVTGVLNVYDDQEWLIREMIRSYKATGNAEYLRQAEYLTEYVLDGWDCSPDTNGDETGGITWGPGYVTKHACSNGPMVAPLVWLYEIYRGRADQVSYGKIDLNGKRYQATQTKEQYYLGFAKKIYAWQKKHLIMPSGVYYDLIGASAGEPQYETVDGVRYRKGLALTEPSGKAYTYNSGTMLSGGAELYRVTRQQEYLADITALAEATFGTFAAKDQDREGYYTYPVDGFSVWFNDVLMRGYAEAYPQYQGTKTALDTFQGNLDYAWANYRRGGLLPVNLLVGWSMSKVNNNVESMFTFAYASEYAVLANWQRGVNEE